MKFAFVRELRKVRGEVIALYRQNRDAGLDHEAAATAVIEYVKDNYQPRSTDTVQITPEQIERWVQIIVMVLTILLLFI